MSYVILARNVADLFSSAATILSLLEEGSFDYDSLFTDQAAFPIEFDDTRPRGERGE